MPGGWIQDEGVGEGGGALETRGAESEWLRKTEGEIKREREREGERERERERDRQTDRQTDRLPGRQTKRVKEIE